LRSKLKYSLTKSKNDGTLTGTPLMRQYYDLKKEHPDAILLFRVGDFYETFGQDAIKTSQALGIVLTNRNNGTSATELAGFPYHSLDLYLPKLVRAGYRVAVCEQMEKPSKEKKIVKRGITEVITPGLAIDEKLLDHKKNNFLAAVYIDKSEQDHGIAFLDISTGEFLVSQGNTLHIEKLMQSFQPAEVLYPRQLKSLFESFFGESFYAYPLDEWIFTEDFTYEKLIHQFQVHSLKGFGIEEFMSAGIAAGVILHYLNTTENKYLAHVNHISRIPYEHYLWLDKFTVRNLELIHTAHEGGKSLVDVIDRTSSPMGARMMRKWILLPLTNLSKISARHDVVAYLTETAHLIPELEEYFRKMGDLERLISKVPSGKINPREILQIKKSLEAIIEIKLLLKESTQQEVLKIVDSLNPCEVLIQKITTTIQEDAPMQVIKGGIIASGVSEELDEIRGLIKNSKQALTAVQVKEIQRTGITNLKIGFNNVFGYYLEVTNKYKDAPRIPTDWIRKQTLSNAERYISDELKQLEIKILTAEDKIQELEEKLFSEILEFLSTYIQTIQQNAIIISRLDCLCAFARQAIERNYTRPMIDESLSIDIINGRHPVIETTLPPGENYVPNDIYLNNSDQQILLITGPNMAGKSALLRQTALNCLMAQIGSFVPAEKLTMGFIDKIFTRVGASDNISSGESTFMVEMNETASIMNNLSERSLILLDEIGRGTSTYDGISIAWSIAEFLHNNPYARPKTLFATHYHELNELSERFPGIRNFSISIKETANKIIFLRKIVEGGSQHSFGIHVAKMAGMPKWIVDRANEILIQLEQKFIEDNKTAIKARKKSSPGQTISSSYQLSIFQTQDPEVEKVGKILKELDLNGMTPIDAFIKLKELQDILSK
jgi:DNA mismatch repair protein MutS